MSSTFVRVARHTSSDSRIHLLIRPESFFTMDHTKKLTFVITEENRLLRLNRLLSHRDPLPLLAGCDRRVATQTTINAHVDRWPIDTRHIFERSCQLAGDKRRNEVDHHDNSVLRLKSYQGAACILHMTYSCTELVPQKLEYHRGRCADCCIKHRLTVRKDDGSFAAGITRRVARNVRLVNQHSHIHSFFFINQCYEMERVPNLCLPYISLQVEFLPHHGRKGRDG